MKKFLSSAIAAVLAVFLVFTSACVPGGNANVSYTVTVVNTKEETIEDVKVIFSKDDAEVASQVTNGQGQVTVELPADEYTVSLDDLPTGYGAGTVTTDTAGSPITITISSGVMSDPAPVGTVYKVGDIIHDFTYEATYLVKQGDEYKEETVTRKLSDSFADGKKMVLLNFYFTTCGPCATEFPLMQTAYSEYDLKVDVIAMCDQNGGGDTLETANSYRYRFDEPLTFFMGYDEGGNTISNNFDPTGYPTNVIIDRFGVICMIDAGSISDVNTFRGWFDNYTSNDYTDSDINDTGNIELEIPDVEDPDPADIAAAINDSSAEGKVTYRFEEAWEYAWPWVVGEDGKTIQTTNKESAGAYAMLYADIKLEEDEVLTFEYRTETENSDIFYVFIDNEIVQQYSGIGEDFAKTYVFVGDGYEHELALVYAKDTGNNVGEDTVYVRNMRVTDLEELNSSTVSIDVLRQAANDYSEATHTYNEYVEAVYNSEDGYYHVGSVDGPLLLADMIEDTRWGEGIYGQAIDALALYNIDLCDEDDDIYILLGEVLGDGSFKNYELIEEYAWYGRYSVYEGSLTPVTKELHDYLVELVSVLGNDDETDNETEWLEICRYYQSYGTFKQDETPLEDVKDPIAGLSIETAKVAHLGDNEGVRLTPKTPRGDFFAFTPAQDATFRIAPKDVTSTTGDTATYLWLFGSNYGDQFEPRPIQEDTSGQMIATLEAGQTYYIACALFNPDDVGSCTLTIEYYNKDYVIRPVASDSWVYDENTGAISLPQFVDVELREDGYYYAYSGDEDYGRIYVDFKTPTSFSDSALVNWIEREYKDENGNVTEVRHMFDLSEDGYYATNADYAELYKELVPEDMRVDFTDIMKEYAAGANSFGFVEADEQLVDILKVIMKLEDRLTDNAWLQLCYYIENTIVVTE